MPAYPQTTHFEAPLLSIVRCAELLEAHSPDLRRHIVQFYNDEAFMTEGVCRFTGRALEAGDSSLVIATEPHRREIEQRLAASGLDIDALASSGRYVSLDAEATLAQIVVNGWPDIEKFKETIGHTISEAANKGRNHFVAAFGEMVALLCGDGRTAAAIELEELWNSLFDSHRFSLFCTYPLAGFAGDAGLDTVLRICDEHSLTLPV